MRSAWIRSVADSYGTIENTAIWDKVAKHQIQRLYLDARHAMRADIDAIHSHRCEAGIFRANNWSAGISAAMFAEQLDQDLHALDAYAIQCHVHAQIEQPHDANYLLAFLNAWRPVRPTRPTGIVLEGMQAGWFTPGWIRAVNADVNVELVAESYTGTMAGLGTDRVRANLISAGIERKRALVFYDGATLEDAWWDGCAFTLERLP